MLSLTSSRWAELTHAYGAAGDIPGFLTRLESGDESAIDDLSGALCHQGSVYGASFAAVPHLVEIAGHLSDADLRANTLVLVGLLASSTDDRSTASSLPDLGAAYQAALPTALRLALVSLQHELEPYDAVYLLQAAAYLNGFVTLGRVLSGFLDEEFTIQCPTCDRELYVWPDELSGGFSTAGEDPIQVPDTLRTPIAAGPASGSPYAEQYRWLREVGGESALSVIGRPLPYLFGSGACPLCDAPFSLLDQLSDSLD